MTRTIKDAADEIRAAFPGCDIFFRVGGSYSSSPQTEGIDAIRAIVPCGEFGAVSMMIPRDLAEASAFDAVSHVRQGVERVSRPRPLDGMRTKGSE